jgi:hypothetical protein
VRRPLMDRSGSREAVRRHRRRRQVQPRARPPRRESPLGRVRSLPRRARCSVGGSRLCSAQYRAMLLGGRSRSYRLPAPHAKSWEETGAARVSFGRTRRGQLTEDLKQPRLRGYRPKRVKAVASAPGTCAGMSAATTSAPSASPIRLLSTDPGAPASLSLLHRWARNLKFCWVALSSTRRQGQFRGRDAGHGLSRSCCAAPSSGLGVGHGHQCSLSTNWGPTVRGWMSAVPARNDRGIAYRRAPAVPSVSHQSSR